MPGLGALILWFKPPAPGKGLLGGRARACQGPKEWPARRYASCLASGPPAARVWQPCWVSELVPRPRNIPSSHPAGVPQFTSAQGEVSQPGRGRCPLAGGDRTESSAGVAMRVARSKAWLRLLPGLRAPTAAAAEGDEMCALRWRPGAGLSRAGADVSVCAQVAAEREPEPGHRVAPHHGAHPGHCPSAPLVDGLHCRAGKPPLLSSPPGLGLPAYHAQVRGLLLLPMYRAR